MTVTPKQSTPTTQSISQQIAQIQAGINKVAQDRGVTLQASGNGAYTQVPISSGGGSAPRDSKGSELYVNPNTGKLSPNLQRHMAGDLSQPTSNFEGQPIPQVPLTEQSKQVGPQGTQVPPPNQQVPPQGVLPQDQALANLRSGGLKGDSLKQAENSLTEYYKKAHELTTASGQMAPTQSGAGAAVANTVMGSVINQPEPPSILGGVQEVDPAFDGIFKMFDDYFSPQKQRTSLVEEYQKLSKSLGLDELNAELIDAKRIIEGTEDDIRAEVTATGGMATDSQVLALANARNKTLIKNYNTLLDTRNAATEQLQTMMQLSITDRESAQKEFDTKMNFAFKVQEFTERARTNATTQFKYLIDNGFGSALLSDPYQTRLAEKTLGLPQGGLSKMMAKQEQERMVELQEQGLDLDIKRQQLYNLQLTGRKVERELGGTTGDVQNLIKAETDIQDVDALAKSSAIDSVVGPSFLSRAPSGVKGTLGRFVGGAVPGAIAGFFAGGPIGAVIGGVGGGTFLASQGGKDKLTGERSNFIAGVEQLRSKLSLDQLTQAKAEGATFGALDRNEWKVLEGAASKLGTWAIKDSDNNILGYNTTEKNIRTELDKINNYAKLDYILKGGDPLSVGAQVIDGKIYVQNSDGSVTQIP